MATSWFNKMKRNLVVAAKGSEYDDTEFDNHKKEIKDLERQIQVVRKMANHFIRTKREANRSFTKFVNDIKEAVADTNSPNLKSAHGLVSNVRASFNEDEERKVFERMIAPIKAFQNMFPVVLKSLSMRKEMLTTFVYYRQLLATAREAIKERGRTDERVEEEKHRNEQFITAKSNFDRANKAALAEIRKLQGRRVAMLRDTIRTIAEEESRLGTLVSKRMQQVLKNLATDDEVESAFRDRHDSITDTNQAKDTRGDGSVFGAPLPEGEKISVVVCKCVNFLRDCALTHCGLFRVPGELVRVNKIKHAFESGEKVDLDKFVGDMGDSGIDVVATLLKLYLRELPDPLFPFNSYRRLIASQQDGLKDNERVDMLNDVLNDPLEVPKKHLMTICLICELLLEITANRDINKMTPENISVCLAPSIIKPPETSTQTDPMAMMDEMTKARSAFCMILRNRDVLFDKSIVDLTRKLVHSEGESLPTPPPRRGGEGNGSNSFVKEEEEEENELNSSKKSEGDILNRPESLMWDSSINLTDVDGAVVNHGRKSSINSKKKIKKKIPPPLLTPRPPSRRNSPMPPSRRNSPRPLSTPPALPPRSTSS
jgi:hypothetical protein